MLNRLYNLVVLQIGDKFVSFKKNKKVLPYLFKLAGFVIITVITYLLLLLMEKQIYLKPTNSMVLFVIFISQVFTLIANSMELTESLYDSKDNAIVLSLPAKHNEVFISKLIVFYILELYSNIMFLLPILIGFGIYTAQGFVFFIGSILISIVLPIVSVLLGALISIPLSLIKKLFKNVSFMYVILFIGLLIVLFYFASRLVAKLPNPLIFVALYDYIVKLILKFIESANRYAIFYKWFANIIFGINVGRNLLYVLALIIGLLIFNFIISRPLFFRLASNTSETAVNKNHKGVNKESKSTFLAFYKKELLISFRTLGSVLENYELVIFMPLILYIMGSLFNSFDLSTFGKMIIFGFNIMVGLFLLTSSNTASAKALSEEGSEFILLKTSPVDTKLVAWAKVLNNIIVSFVLLSVSIILLGIMKVFVFKELILIFITLFLVNAGHILWSFQLDLRNPQIKDVALFGTISNKENITKSTTIGVVISVLFGAMAILLRYVGLLPIFLGIVIAFTVWRLLVFDANLKSYFYDIEL